MRKKHWTNDSWLVSILFQCKYGVFLNVSFVFFYFVTGFLNPAFVSIGKRHFSRLCSPWKTKTLSGQNVILSRYYWKLLISLYMFFYKWSSFIGISYFIGRNEIRQKLTNSDLIRCSNEIKYQLTSMKNLCIIHICKIMHFKYWTGFLQLYEYLKKDIQIFRCKYIKYILCL